MQRILTPARPTAGFDSRPNALVRELQGAAYPEVESVHVGRSYGGASVRSRIAARLIRRNGSSCGILTPLALRAEVHNAIWVDAYDDWSIAPEMAPAIRAVAGLGYSALLRSSTSALVTVNSAYMLDKLIALSPVLIPNGVPRFLGHCDTGTNESKRLILMGHFFDGRTDWRMLQRSLVARTVDEVIVYGDGERVASMVGRARSDGAVVDLRPPTPIEQVAREVGPRTTLLIPHLVTDYTLSQDLMKVYQFLALGATVITPNALWPSLLDRRLGLSLDFGVDLETILEASFEWPRLSAVARKNFVDEHGWNRRGQPIVQALR